MNSLSSARSLPKTNSKIRNRLSEIPSDVGLAVKFLGRKIEPQAKIARKNISLNSQAKSTVDLSLLK
jgi:hypothetical protein